MCSLLRPKDKKTTMRGIITHSEGLTVLLHNFSPVNTSDIKNESLHLAKMAPVTHPPLRCCLCL